MPPKRPPLEPVCEDDPPVAEDLLRQMTALCALLSQQLPSSTSAAQPASEPPLRLNLTIPTFSGYSDAKSVEDFLAALEAYQTAVGATDEAVLRRILPAALAPSEVPHSTRPTKPSPGPRRPSALLWCDSLQPPYLSRCDLDGSPRGHQCLLRIPQTLTRPGPTSSRGPSCPGPRALPRTHPPGQTPY
ncbi:uncharacterized protein LOC135392991 [Ornithodoros turicata]|uniref:uncharacterized protein LOC135392991 n=1 Tax=Ornithodoros turicata TaxID=34597 RepID=UPI00313945B6